jgi:hypothetical protein
MMQPGKMMEIAGEVWKLRIDLVGLQEIRWSHRKNAGHSNPHKDVWKAVCNKTQRKTKNEMAG